MNKGLIAFYFFFVVVYWRIFYVSEVTTQPHPTPKLNKYRRVAAIIIITIIIMIIILIILIIMMMMMILRNVSPLRDF